MLVILGMSAWNTPAFFTEARATAKGAEADIWVDKINDGATAADKTAASNYYAVALLLEDYWTFKSLSVIKSSVAGSAQLSFDERLIQRYIAKAKRILRVGTATTAFPIDTPSTGRSW